MQLKTVWVVVKLNVVLGTFSKQELALRYINSLSGTFDLVACYLDVANPCTVGYQSVQGEVPDLETCGGDSCAQ